MPQRCLRNKGDKGGNQKQDIAQQCEPNVDHNYGIQHGDFQSALLVSCDSTPNFPDAG